ncbi:hypothetical protein BDZ45DRAFT_686277 [Acephala macrosclerotiorum]|nr:hypothetical protein BDZ45DRAFT_686277 [Acephala macrosclerotiorum]
MCKWCEKIQPTIRGFDYQLSKPIFLALAVLNHNIEPNLGDRYRWKYDKMSAIRIGLTAIHETWMLPLEQIEEIETEIDEELVSLKEKMIEHPPKKGLGRWQTFNASTVTPSQSASDKVRKWLGGLPEVRIGRSQVSPSQSSLHSIYRKPLPDRPGSDIDPPLPIIKQSIRGVQAWLKDCNEAVVPSYTDSDESLISIMGGLMGRRPLDVRIWKRTRKPVGESVQRPVHSATDGPTISDCLYDDPHPNTSLDSTSDGVPAEEAEEIESVMSGALGEGKAHEVHGRAYPSSRNCLSFKNLSALAGSAVEKVQDFIHPASKWDYKAPACQTMSTTGDSICGPRTIRYSGSNSSNKDQDSSTSSQHSYTATFRGGPRHTPGFNKTPCLRGVCNHTFRGTVELGGAVDKSSNVGILMNRNVPSASLIKSENGEILYATNPEPKGGPSTNTASSFDLGLPSEAKGGSISQSWSTSGSIYDPDLEAIMREQEKDLDSKGLWRASHAEGSLSSALAILNWDTDYGGTTERASGHSCLQPSGALTVDLSSKKESQPTQNTQLRLRVRATSESSYETSSKERTLRHVDSLLLPKAGTTNLISKMDVAESKRRSQKLGATASFRSHHTSQHTLTTPTTTTAHPTHVFISATELLEAPEISAAEMRALVSLHNDHESPMSDTTKRRRLRRIPRLPSTGGTSVGTSSEAALASEKGKSEIPFMFEGSRRRRLRRTPQLPSIGEKTRSAFQENVTISEAGGLTKSVKLEAVPEKLTSTWEAQKESPVVTEMESPSSQQPSSSTRLPSSTAGAIGANWRKMGVATSKVATRSFQRTTGHYNLPRSPDSTLTSQSSHSPTITRDNSSITSRTSKESSFHLEMPKPLESEYEKKKIAVEGSRRESRLAPLTSFPSQRVLIRPERDLALGLRPSQASNPAPLMGGAEMEFARNRERRRVKRGMHASSYVPSGPSPSELKRKEVENNKNMKYKGRREEQRPKEDPKMPLSKKRRERGPGGSYRSEERQKYWKTEKP